MYTANEKLATANITDIMQTAYIDYSMSVIISRALPDGFALCDGVLREVAPTRLTGREQHELRPPGRYFSANEVASLVADVIPDLEQRVPVSIETQRLARGRREPPRLRVETERRGDALLERQNWRLARWRMGERDVAYRRFFDIDHLVGLRVEESRVFAETHARILAGGQRRRQLAPHRRRLGRTHAEHALDHAGEQAARRDGSGARGIDEAAGEQAVQGAEGEGGGERALAEHRAEAGLDPRDAAGDWNAGGEFGGEKQAEEDGGSSGEGNPALESGEREGLADETEGRAERAVGGDAPEVVGEAAKDERGARVACHRQREGQRTAHAGAVKAADEAEGDGGDEDSRR